MLQYEEIDRITIDDVLRHPYILSDIKDHQKLIKPGINMASMIKVLSTRDR